MSATLSDILVSRDRRQALQRKLLHGIGINESVCQLTVIPPGDDKELSGLTLQIGREGLRAVAASPLYAPLSHKAMTCAGFEALWIAPMSPLDAKRTAVALEENHPLGRLFDIDVLDADGTPINRIAIGASPRRCLLCDEDAKVCSRSRRHSVPSLLTAFRHIASAFPLERCDIIQ